MKWLHEVGLNVRKYIFIIFVFSFILQNNNKTTRAKCCRTTGREKKRAVGCDLQRSPSRLTVWGPTFSSPFLLCYSAQSDAVPSDSLHSRQSTVGGDKPTCDELLQPQKQHLSGDGGTFRDCQQQPKPGENNETSTSATAQYHSSDLNYTHFNVTHLIMCYIWNLLLRFSFQGIKKKLLKEQEKKICDITSVL